MNAINFQNATVFFFLGNKNIIFRKLSFFNATFDKIVWTTEIGSEVLMSQFHTCNPPIIFWISECSS